MDFWKQREGNTRLDDELRLAAEKLLKGCVQHFRSAVTRVKKISGVIPPEQMSFFESCTCALLDATNIEDFLHQAQTICEKFPKVIPWLQWWLRPSHASMLFKSQHVMDPDIWDSIPDSTNAEEAMHWKLYATTGCKHDLMEGLCSLVKMAEYYERLSIANTRKCAPLYF